MSALQDAANFQTSGRSYLAKYPGQAGTAMRAHAAQVLERLDASNMERAANPAPAAVTASRREARRQRRC
jgi:hypothetical protein